MALAQRGNDRQDLSETATVDLNCARTEQLLYRRLIHSAFSIDQLYQCLFVYSFLSEIDALNHDKTYIVSIEILYESL